ncbi:hypothetical protein IFM89_038266 [Coptis chinensis]|uniref:NAC domain-containing protein n=1 Tax=Coptis chinensis TaxID=261450 RepID=A0A835HBT0_9MAGN|nr:hypothetical protein IFM89_038266 [Coptis chinensis]
MEEVPLELPRGFRFAPTDEELITYFLAKILAREPLPELYNNIIMPCELYGSEAFEPWQLLKGREEENEVYVFTSIKQKYDGGKKIGRTVGSEGWTWRISNSSDILDQEGNKIGCKKFMNYSKNNGKVKSPWMMYEFTMKDHEEYSLCRVFRKNKKDASTSASSSKRPEETDDDLSYAANNKRTKTSNYTSTSTAPMTSQPVDGGPAEECRSRFGSSSQPDAFGVNFIWMQGETNGCICEASCFSNYAYPDTPLPPMQGPADDIPQESGTGSTSYVLSSTSTDEVCNWESTSNLDVPPEGSYYDYQAENEPTLQQN